MTFDFREKVGSGKNTSYFLPPTSSLFFDRKEKNMLILSRVCAEFRDHTGTVIHRVTPETRLTFREAPEAIREDPLFQMLLNDGSLEAAVTSVQRKKLEAEPLEGTDATGRKVPAAAPPEGETRPNPSGRKQNGAKTAPQADSTAAENNK